MNSSTSNDSGYSSPKSSLNIHNKAFQISNKLVTDDKNFHISEKGKSKIDCVTKVSDLSDTKVRPNKSYKEIVAKILLNSDKGEMSLREIVDKVLKKSSKSLVKFD